MSHVLSTILLVFSLAWTIQAQPASLTVAAASDLTSLEPELEAGWQKTNPGVTLRFVTGASATLMQQIENGAPYDIFLSANAHYVEQLVTRGKISPRSVIPYAVGRVGILWKDGKRHSLDDLRGSSIRFIALPNPKLAPYGVAAQQILQHAGVWKAVGAKVVYGENVRQTLQLFQSGNADVVLTSDSLLQGEQAEVLPAGWHDPIVQKAGIVANSAQEPAAQSFLTFLASPKAQAIFARFGFSRP